MPAEGSGGSNGRHRHRRARLPDPGVVAPPARRPAGHRRRLRARPRPRPRPGRRPRRRRPRLGVARRRWPRPTPPASPVERHPPDKDATDTELALDAAVARGADRIVVREPAAATASTTLLAGAARCSRPPALAAPASRPGSAPACVRVAARARPAPRWTARPGRLRVARCPCTARPTASHRRPALPAARPRRWHAGTSRGVSNELLGGPGRVAAGRAARSSSSCPHALGGAP